MFSNGNILKFIVSFLLIVGTFVPTINLNKVFAATTYQQTIYFSTSTSRSQTQTITIPNLDRVVSATVDTGSVSTTKRRNGAYPNTGGYNTWP
ncbi:hypothetical protein Mahau_0013 [Mahella australiensis 50-1 BON]|uniref:Uncharacterized protein n=1 Tax=Mahella australiensis (strain DSM 15567 / CIP 107919 / 50-1 BON) TaxID=697281 RepID=F4A322_MAHA5|nr:hypothetical protein Mahau_0013 [Mahella australiensis 50-1 BON]